jgi:hypothetical protein
MLIIRYLQLSKPCNKSNEFIENIDKYKKELKTLITPNFQTFENVNIVTV